MISLWLLLLLFIACGAAVFAFQRLQGVSDRLKDLHEDLARNDDQLRRHLTRLQAADESARIEELAENGSEPAKDASEPEANDQPLQSEELTDGKTVE